jgi:hypothetical protein
MIPRWRISPSDRAPLPPVHPEVVGDFQAEGILECGDTSPLLDETTRR